MSTHGVVCGSGELFGIRECLGLVACLVIVIQVRRAHRHQHGTTPSLSGRPGGQYAERFTTEEGKERLAE